MSHESHKAVEDAEDEYREHCAKLIAQSAAQLVAAGDMGRIQAIDGVTEWLRREGAAEEDATGVAAIENGFPSPSKATPRSQVTAIASELLDAAREAADTLGASQGNEATFLALHDLSDLAWSEAIPSTPLPMFSWFSR